MKPAEYPHQKKDRNWHSQKPQQHSASHAEFSSNRLKGNVGEDGRFPDELTLLWIVVRKPAATRGYSWPTQLLT